MQGVARRCGVWTVVRGEGRADTLSKPSDFTDRRRPFYSRFSRQKLCLSAANGQLGAHLPSNSVPQNKLMLPIVSLPLTSNNVLPECSQVGGP